MHLGTSLFNTSNHIYNFTASLRVVASRLQGRGTCSNWVWGLLPWCIYYTKMLVVSVLQTRLWLDVIRHTQVKLLPHCQLCVRCSWCTRQSSLGNGDRSQVEIWQQSEVYAASPSRQQTRLNMCPSWLPVCDPYVRCQCECMLSLALQVFMQVTST